MLTSAYSTPIIKPGEHGEPIRSNISNQIKKTGSLRFHCCLKTDNAAKYEIRIALKKKRKKKDQVRLYWTGYQLMPIHERYPTTAQHGNFCLLCFHPGPIRPSLDNLGLLGSPERPILMLSLARTPDRHRTPEGRTPALKPSSDPDLHAAGL